MVGEWADAAKHRPPLTGLETKAERTQSRRRPPIGIMGWGLADHQRPIGSQEHHPALRGDRRRTERARGNDCVALLNLRIAADHLGASSNHRHSVLHPELSNGPSE